MMGIVLFIIRVSAMLHGVFMFRYAAAQLRSCYCQATDNCVLASMCFGSRFFSVATTGWMCRVNSISSNLSPSPQT